MSTIAELAVDVEANAERFKSGMASVRDEASKTKSHLQAKVVDRLGCSEASPMIYTKQVIRYEDLTSLLELGAGAELGRAVFEKVHEGVETSIDAFAEARAGGESLGDSFMAIGDKLLGLKTAKEMAHELADEFARGRKSAGEMLSGVSDVRDAFGLPNHIEKLEISTLFGNTHVRDLPDSMRHTATEQARKIREKQEEFENMTSTANLAKLGLLPTAGDYALAGLGHSESLDDKRRQRNQLEQEATRHLQESLQAQKMLGEAVDEEYGIRKAMESTFTKGVNAVFGNPQTASDFMGVASREFSGIGGHFGDFLNPLIGSVRDNLLHPLGEIFQKRSTFVAPGSIGGAAEYGSAESFKQIEESREALQNLQAQKLDQQIVLQQQTVTSIQNLGKEGAKTIGVYILNSLFP